MAVSVTNQEFFHYVHFIISLNLLDMEEGGVPSSSASLSSSSLISNSSSGRRRVLLSSSFNANFTFLDILLDIFSYPLLSSNGKAWSISLRIYWVVTQLGAAARIRLGQLIKRSSHSRGWHYHVYHRQDHSLGQ